MRSCKAVCLVGAGVGEGFLKVSLNSGRLSDSSTECASWSCETRAGAKRSLLAILAFSRLAYRSNPSPGSSFQNVLTVIYLSLGFDVGRGTGSFDEEGRRFIVSSISMKIWHVKEYSYQLLPEEEYGHFFSSEG